MMDKNSICDQSEKKESSPGDGGLMVALILPSLRRKASGGEDCKDEANTAMTVLVPAIQVYPFSRVACELLDEEALPQMAENNPSALLRPIGDFASGEDDDNIEDGKSENILPIDISFTRVVQLPSPSPNQELRVHCLIKTLFRSSFEALQRYQVYTQQTHMKRMTTCPTSPPPLAAVTSSSAVSDRYAMSRTVEENEEEVLTLQRLLRDAVTKTFTNPHHNTTTASVEPHTYDNHDVHPKDVDVDNSHEGTKDDDHEHNGIGNNNQEGTTATTMTLMLYVLTVLEVLDCPLLSEALSDIIVERGAYYWGRVEDGSSSDHHHRLLMAELLLL